MSMIIDGTNGATFPDTSTQAKAGLVAGGTIATGTITTLTAPTSTITTLNAPSGVLATQNGMTGIAKAWVQFAGSTGTIAGSFNVSSVTRLGTGRYTVNLTTAMSNANYSVCASTSPSGTAAALAPQIFSTDGVTGWTTSAPTTTTFSLVTPLVTTNLADMPYVCATVFGT